MNAQLDEILSQHVKRMNRSVSFKCALSESGRVECTSLETSRRHKAPRPEEITFSKHSINNQPSDEMNDAKLIDLVEAQPCIYDKTDLFYSNKEHVRSIWQMIAGEMQQEVPVCQKRWRYLRDYFVRQLHITENNNNNTNDVDGKPLTASVGKRSYWPLYDRLSFLKPFSSTRRRLKRSSTEDVTTTQALKVEDDINSTAPSICSDGSDRTRVSSSSNASANYTDAIANLDYVKFYQAMQVAAQQQNLNSTGSPQEYASQLSVEFDKTQSKRKRNQSSYLPSFQPVDYAIDEHDCFFKSLLSSVRRISDEHVIAFRTEVLQVIMKYRHLSEAGDGDYEETNDEQSGDDVVVVNTEEAHWRKNLFRRQY